MKLIFSFLLLPAILCGVICGIAGAMVWLGSTSIAPEAPYYRHLLYGAMHLAVGTGLIASLVNLCYSAVLCVTGFVIKSWTGAIFSGGLAAFSFFLLQYLLNSDVP